MLAKYLKGLGVQDFFFLILPIVLLVFWILFYRAKNYIAILILSILLVLFSLPHLLIIPAVLGGGGSFGSDSLLYLLLPLLLGGFCLVLGIWGTIISIRGFSGRSTG